MKKNVLIFGGIAGVQLSRFMAFSIVKCYNQAYFKEDERVGDAAILFIFSWFLLGLNISGAGTIMGDPFWKSVQSRVPEKVPKSSFCDPDHVH